MNHDSLVLPNEMAAFLNPLLGGDRLAKRLASVLPTPPNGFPPYDTIKISDAEYRIVIALAGYSPDDIDVTFYKGTLLVKSAPKNAEGADDGVSFIHRGIARRSFKLSFSLIDELVVRDCVMKDGMLTITLDLIVPEEAKPHRIEIKS